VRRYARAATADELLTVSATRRKNLDDHIPYLLKRWEQGCGNSETLHKELTERGYKGSARAVRRLRKCSGTCRCNGVSVMVFG
jgi:hypothetical protein